MAKPVQEKSAPAFAPALQKIIQCSSAGKMLLVPVNDCAG